MSKGSTSKTLVWILMGLLILGLGGFGVTNLSGTVRSVGDVGGKDIDINDYARALQQELNALGAQTGRNVSFGEAQAAGIDSLVLGNLVVQRAMDAETARMGVSIGDERLRSELLAIPGFQGVNGEFDRDAYRYALDQTRLTEAEFEDSIREETARTLLQGSVVSGVAMPAIYGDTILDFIGEQRDITLARLKADDLVSPISEPTEGDLRAFYDANLDQFTLPAMRQITYALLTPDMLIDEVEVDEESLQALFEQRNEEFNRPERRLVERLAFADMASAEAARARLNSGEASFEMLVEERGLTLVDVDMGDVSMAELGEAGETVFGAVIGAISGPVQSSLGPALFRINGILPALETPFEEAVPTLREELAAERARRLIEAQIGDLEDLLAAGATLEELTEESDMQLGQVGWHQEESAGIAGYETFRALASIVTKDDFPEIEILADGGLFALRLDGETEATPAPFEDVRDDVAAAWADAETVSRLQDMADGMLPSLGGDVDFAAFGLTAEQRPNILRSGFVADTPEGFVDAVFAMETGTVTTIPAGDELLIVKMTAVNKPDRTNPEIANLMNALLQQGAQGLSQDLFEAYAQEIQFVHGVTINQQALNAVHAQFQ
ncbi:peptidylprolyl isomerase [uncultured Shimia sp.]|uniref:peptidylprolyl isomerase n=1 Tax=uncultured Shimia sp. TaxID=573152 RepID=UPI00263954CF|nr:peptidylprolyl isomerase [uncultured Shimia sp.]